MVNIFLFIELLKMTDVSATVERLKALEMSNCRFANVFELNKEKIVAQLDCANIQRCDGGDLAKDQSRRGYRTDEHHSCRAARTPKVKARQTEGRAVLFAASARD